MPVLGAFGWGAGITAFAAGIVSFFSPCVAPLVPGYISYLAGTALGGYAGRPPADDAVAGNGEAATVMALRAAALRPCLLFVGGFSAAFVALGMLAASFGSLLVAYRPVLDTIAGIVMLAMGAFLLGLLPRAWTELLSREWRLPARNSPLPAGEGPGVRSALGDLAPFGLGVVFAAGWTPCIGPVLGSILLAAGASASLGRGAALLALYALGFALPFVAVGMGWSVGLRALGWVKRHGQVVTTASGVALVLLGVIYLTGEVSQISIWAQRVAPNFG